MNSDFCHFNLNPISYFLRSHCIEAYKLKLWLTRKKAFGRILACQLTSHKHFYLYLMCTNPMYLHLMYTNSMYYIYMLAIIMIIRKNISPVVGAIRLGPRSRSRIRTRRTGLTCLIPFPSRLRYEHLNRTSSLPPPLCCCRSCCC